MPFEIVDGKLFTNAPKTEIPDWIANTAFTKPVQRTLAIDFNTDIINRKHVIAERSMHDDGRIRNIRWSFTDKQRQIFAMTELARFLKTHRYNVLQSVSENGKVTITESIQDSPAEYMFSYIEQDGKIQSEPFFHTKLADVKNEYPFSNAGLEDAIAESKNEKTKQPIKVARTNYSVMTRYDIVKRCNNELSTARDLINQHVKDGLIVSVGSNEYASIYDMSYLFPDMRETQEKQASHTAEFVNNHVAHKVNAHKSDNLLIAEASKILNDTFNVHHVVTAMRDGNDFLVTAEIVHNNIQDVYHFNFEMQKERIAKLRCVEDANDNRYSTAQLLNKFDKNDNRVLDYLNGKDERIAGGYVYATKTLQSKLAPHISKQNMEKMFDGWKKSGLATALNSSTYASKYSLNELIQKTNTEMYDEETANEIRAAQSYFNTNPLHRHAMQDNDTRTAIALKNQQAKLDKLNALVGKHLKDFTITMIDGNNFVISFTSDKRRDIHASCVNDTVHCVVGSQRILIDNLAKRFAQSDLLKQYIADGHSNDRQRIVISRNEFMKKLANFLNEQKIDSLINSLVKNGKLIRTATNQYVSEYSFEDLLRDTDLIADKGLKAYRLQQQQRAKSINANHITDGDTRSPNYKLSISDIETLYNQQLPKHIVATKFNDVDMNESSVYVTLLNKNNGLTANVKTSFATKDGKATFDDMDYDAIFHTTKAASTFAKYSNTATSKHKTIISAYELKHDLQKIANTDNIDSIINQWEKSGKIKRISSNQFASDYTLSDLVAMSNLRGYSDEQIQKNFKKADVSAIHIPKAAHMQSTGSRMMSELEDGRDMSELNNIKNNHIEKLHKLASTNKITTRKHEQLYQEFLKANTAQELETVYRDMCRYL